MALQTGIHLGPYEILALLGAGGMGEVYKAHDTRLRRTVAVKVLPATLARDSQFRERFEREARALSQLTHPHICTLYDVGQHDQTDYLVMEYLEGETLDKVIRRGPIQIDQALKVASEIAEALDRAHRAGIVHRDMKPGNVMLTREGVKLLDFGVAKFRDPNAVPPEDTLTVAGTIIGTIQYMAPEQLEAGAVDARTDIFAFGSVLYEMLTGRKAFEGKSQASVIAAILNRDHASPDGNTLTPPELDRLVRKCLQKDPDERWQSAKDLGDELRWLARSSHAMAAPSPAADRRPEKSRRRFIFRITIGFLSLLMAAATYSVIRNRSRRVQEVAIVEPPPTPAPVEAAATSPPPAAETANMVSRTPTNLKPVMEVGKEGIGRKPGEADADYTARARQIVTMLAEGQDAAGKQDYATALARFRTVDREAPAFQNVAALIADTLARQRQAVETAIDSGQQNEAAGKILEARRWYDVALQRDPSSVIAREKRAAIVLRMNAAAEALYNQATFALKTGNAGKARELFQQVVDTTMPGDEFRNKATKELDLLKR